MFKFIQGYTNAAVYLKHELLSKKILDSAFNNDLSRNTNKYDLIIVGHSYGAGMIYIYLFLFEYDNPKVKFNLIILDSLCYICINV